MGAFAPPVSAAAQAGKGCGPRKFRCAGVIGVSVTLNGVDYTNELNVTVVNVSAGTFVVSH